MKNKDKTNYNMIFKISKEILDSQIFTKKSNILSFNSNYFYLSLVLIFKGLNLGVDFKGGTLIEIRTDNSTLQLLQK